MVKLFKYEISYLEIIVLIVFALYLVFNVQTPTFLVGVVDTPIGIFILLLFILYLFLYTNPILGILSLFVVYEMVRRSSLTVSGKVPMIQYTPTQIQKERDMHEMNIPNAFEQLHQDPLLSMNTPSHNDSSLEIEMVHSMAPLIDAPISYIDSSYKPMIENTHNASYA